MTKELKTRSLQAASDSISNHGVAHILGDDESKPHRPTIRAVVDVTDNMTCTELAPATHCSPIVIGAHYPVHSGKHNDLAVCSVALRLGREFSAALAATSTQDRTAGTSAHAQAKSMDLRATTVIRLESSLAHN